MEFEDTSFYDVIRTVLHKRQFRRVRSLDKGGFGEIVSAVSPSKDPVAIKMIKNAKSWRMEEEIWPRLDHGNVVKLLDIIEIPELSLNLYVMPRYPFVLDRLVFSADFKASVNGMIRVKKWFKGVLDGLQYFHSSGYAHMDIKANNVLISADDNALLCDFSGINSIGVPLNRQCAPLQFRPPECFNALPCMIVEGVASDVWQFGLMCLTVLTGNWTTRNMGPMDGVSSWKTSVEPVLIKALKMKTFSRLLRKSFPSVKLTEVEIATILDFVTSIMQWEEKKRPPVEKILNHAFLENLENCKTSLDAKPEEFKNEARISLTEGCTEHETQCVSDKKVNKEKSKETADSKNVILVQAKYEEIKNEPGMTILEEHEAKNKYVPDKKADKVDSRKTAFMDKRRVRRMQECDEHLPVVQRYNNIYDSTLHLLRANEKNDVVKKLPKKSTNFGVKIKRWMKKKWDKAFQPKKEYVMLSNELE